MKTVQSSAALDRATPARLWVYVAFIVLIGVAVRVIWFIEFEHDLPFAFGETLSGHAWALEPSFRAMPTNVAVNSYDVTQAFAPGYGAMLHALTAVSGGSAASNHTVSISLLAAQSVCVALATLVTFALSRRVLFGYAALIPAVLLTASIALIELPGGLAPSIPLMLLIILAIWQLTILQERLPEGRGPRAMLLTVGAGFTIGAAILFNPAVLLLAPLILWWAFCGLGSEHATLLLVGAAILLPASWLAVAQTQLPDGIPTAQAKAWIQKDSGNFPTTIEQAGDRAYAIATPWNARFARGDYASKNWNYEWILPLSLRTDTTYQAATRGLVAFFMVMFVLLIILGLTELFAEGAGSGARLLALPVVSLPFVTFLSDGGNILRIPMLPFMLIALTLGSIWLIENLRPFTHERRSERRQEWT
ncbi:MAG: hypothetical protein ACSLFF_02325 [Solirubrobacterales bacterium]